mgnify:FL=1
MLKHGFHKTHVDHCVFVKRYNEGDFLILLLYLDDMLVVGQNIKKSASLKKALIKSFRERKNIVSKYDNQVIKVV